MHAHCDLHNHPLVTTLATCPYCQALNLKTQGMLDAANLSDAQLEELNNPRFGEYIIPRKAISYIATYQAECVDGNQVTANLALSDVPEGASPGSIIELITEQAYADIAGNGMNATRVLVLNLSRVW